MALQRAAEAEKVVVVVCDVDSGRRDDDDDDLTLETNDLALESNEAVALETNEASPAPAADAEAPTAAVNATIARADVLNADDDQEPKGARMPDVLPPLSGERAVVDSWWEVVHDPVVVLRAMPSVLSQGLSKVPRGEIVAAKAVEEYGGHKWLRLADAELDNLMINFCQPEPPTQGFALIDGSALGFGLLLKQVGKVQHPPRPIWDLSHRLYAALHVARGERLCRVALPHRVRYAKLLTDAKAAEESEDHATAARLNAEHDLDAIAGTAPRPAIAAAAHSVRAAVPLVRHGYSPMRPQYLSCWIPEQLAAGDGRLVKAARGSSVLGTADGREPTMGQLRAAPVPVAADAPRPRLAVACLLRDAPIACVRAWIAYHLALGFDPFLYFDDPADRAIPGAREFEPRATVTLCTVEFWQEQRASNDFFKQERSRRPSRAHWDWGAGVFDERHEDDQGGNPLHPNALNPDNFERGDVQSRQCAAVQHATSLAARRGYDWMLHVDIDELWFSPRCDVQRDAPRAFAAVPESVTQLVFHNHEAVPRYDAPRKSWFAHQPLFKVHTAFTRSVAENEAERVSRGKGLAKERRKDAAEAAGQAFVDDSDGSDREPEKVEEDFAREEAPLGQVFSTIGRNRGFRVKQDPPEVPPDERRSKWRQLRAAGDVKGMRKALREHRKQSMRERSLFAYYTAHDQGKAAVRLRPRIGAEPYPKLPKAGIHLFTFSGSGVFGEQKHYCEGAGAPVVLHYPNANFAYWVRKYEMLTKDPKFGEGAQISLRRLPKLHDMLERLHAKAEKEKEEKARRGETGDGGKPGKKTKDGPGDEDNDGVGAAEGELAEAMKEARKDSNDPTDGMHGLAAALIGRGDKKSFDLARSLYRMQYCVADTLPEMASNGLLCEITFPRDLLAELGVE